MTTSTVKFKQKLNTGLHETSFHLVSYSVFVFAHLWYDLKRRLINSYTDILGLKER
jgi:hypothetical protein